MFYLSIMQVKMQMKSRLCTLLISDFHNTWVQGVFFLQLRLRIAFLQQRDDTDIDADR